MKSEGSILPKPERERIIEEVVKGEYLDENDAVLGENRGQLFVRIPVRISKRMNWEKGQRVNFRIKVTATGENELSLEAIE